MFHHNVHGAQRNFCRDLILAASEALDFIDELLWLFCDSAAVLPWGGGHFID